MNFKLLTLSTTILMSLFISSCSSESDKICECLKKAANTFMVKGEKASEHDLYTMCNQFEGALKNADVDEKRIVQACIDNVKKQIEDKILFTDVEDIELPEIPCGASFKKELDKINEINYKKKRVELLEYYLKDRKLNCKIVVNGVTKKPYYTFAEGNNSNHYRVDNGFIYVNGYIYDEKNNIENLYLTLLLPEKEKEKIILPKNGKEKYQQIIKFSGKLNSLMENGLGELIPSFSLSSYELISLNNSTSTVEKDNDENEIEMNEEINPEEPVIKDEIVYYKINDPDGYSNLRKEPKGEIIKKVYDTELFEVLGEENDHKKIKLKDGTIGYIHKSRVVKETTEVETPAE